MNIINNTMDTIWLKKIFFFSILATTLISCSEDNVVTPPQKSSTKYVVAFEANPIGKEEPIDYILELPSLEALTSGEINVKNKGIPQTGWRFFHQTNNTLFTAGYSKDVTCKSYEISTEGVLQEKSKFTFDKTLDSYASTEDGKMIAVELSYDGLGQKRFHIVDAKTGKVERIIAHDIDIDKGDGTKENPGSIPWVTGMVQRGNKLFVSYHKWLADGSYKTPDTERAYIAIFSYPSFEFEKIIYDTRTSPIGINGHNTGILKTENGDLYSYSSSALSAGFTSATKPSAILKIKNNTTEFDNDYFFDVENAPNGGKVYWMSYIGNGKAIARIINDDSVGAYEWGAFLKTDVLKMVVIDFYNKTVTDIAGIPNPHGQRYTTPAFIENGKVYISVTTPIETRVYIVDPESASAKKGAKVDAKSLKGIFKLKTDA
ncbi:DUF4374 domain-containing protein [Tenacibaculum maritimum]|uniref:DUF4374 domain-containing protein n=1 Tax=Tenacibaculum maritimum TaxID=107401 RepID=UPI003875FFAD